MTRYTQRNTHIYKSESKGRKTEVIKESGKLQTVKPLRASKETQLMHGA